MYDHSNSQFGNNDPMNVEPVNRAQHSGRKSKPASNSNSLQPEPSVKCSYCGKSFLRSESKNMPFCSRSCQQIDLGMWLNESYGIPYEGESSLDAYERVDDDDQA